MEFDLAPQPLRQRGWRGAAVVAAAGIAIIAFALATAGTPDTPPSGSPAAIAAGTVTPPPTPQPTAIARTVGLPVAAPDLPDQDAILCRDLDQVTCGQVARASIATLTTADGPVTYVSVSPSLLCNDDVACPSAKLVGSRPLGSAVVSLGSGAQAWVNVVGPAANSGRVWEPDRTTAWVARWVP